MERMTRQKQAVLQAIERSGRSLHPLEIQALARVDAPTLNLSTVYRQLKTLVDERRVTRVELPGQPARFENATAPRTGHEASLGHPHAHGETGADTPDHHHHFHCLRCEQVFPIHACPGHMEHLAPQGFRIERHDLTLHGHCAACAASPPAPTRRTHPLGKRPG